MSGIEFETDNKARQFGGAMGQPLQQNSDNTPTILKYIMKLSGGLIKDEKTAGFAAFVVFVGAIIVSIFVIPNLGHKLPSEDMHTKNSKNGQAYYAPRAIPKMQQ